MPYFTRRPYAETVARVSAAPSADLPVAAPSADPVDMLALAEEVLAAETGRAGEAPLRIRRPLQPGGRGAMLLELALEPGEAPLTLGLAASDLVGPGGRIPAGAVRISPASLTLRPDAPAEVEVSVTAPPDAAPGRYAGTLSATGGETFALPFEAELR